MQPYIRGGVLEFFRGTVERLGGDTDELLRRCDVAPEILTVPGIYLPYANYMRLLHAAAEQTSTPHFGLLMSRSASAETLGTTGIIMTQAKTVGDAWKTLTHFYRIHDTYGAVGFELSERSAMVRYALPRNDQPGTRQVYDVAAGITTNIMRRFCGAGYQLVCMAFPYARPDSLDHYSGLSALQLAFDSTTLEAHFDIDLWNRSLPEGSVDQGLGQSGGLELYRGATQSTSSLVEEMIRRWLPSGDCTLPFIAATLAMTTRTLQLRLESEHSSFRDILEKVRRDIATFHLRRRDMSLTQLAMVLGYSELSAFSRSFRRWFGSSPQQWQSRVAGPEEGSR